MTIDEATRPWRPLPPRTVADWCRRADAPFWIGGGWALDLWLGHLTREHGDTDVVILRRDVAAFQRAFASWTVMMADPPGSLRTWDVDAPLPDHVHDVWLRRAASDCWEFQFMVVDSEGDDWLFRRDPRIRRPLVTIGCVRDGLPLLAPEIQLLFKAKPDRRAKDDRDLARILPRLNDERRSWLMTAVHTAHPDSAIPG